MITYQETHPLFTAVEVATSESLEVLWVEPYRLERLHEKGETFIKDSKTYLVLDSSTTNGKLGAILVEHRVRLVSE